MVVFCKQMEEVGMCFANKRTTLDKDCLLFIFPACVLLSMGKAPIQTCG